ncbi:response regulator [bacterium]|nr:response regulator [bacterium]MBU1637620.1 response regulator [bacterium]
MSVAKVMVVDDDDRYLELLEFMLSASDFEVIAESDSKQVQSRAEETQPEIIVLDMAMPEQDGIAVGMGLKSSAATKHIPIVYVTAMSGSADMHEAKRIGAARYLTKPFAPMELINTLKQILAERQAERARA